MTRETADTRHITLKERLEAFYNKPIEEIDNIEPTEAVDTSSPVGEEII